MTHEEALHELELTPPASREEIRRRYLSLLKRRKPEADPVGFARLRAAYECLSASAEEALAYVPDSPLAHLPVPPPDSFEALAERMALAEAARQRFPDLPAAHVLHARLLFEAGEGAGAVQVLREAPQTPALEALKELLFRAPEALSAAERDAVVPCVSPALAWSLAGIAARKGALEAALALSEGGFRADPHDATLPSPSGVLAVVLALHAADRPAEARQLTRRLATWLDATGRETALLSFGSAHLWQCVRELEHPALVLPAEARAAIALGVMAGDLTAVGRDLRLRVRRQLLRHSPLLAQALEVSTPLARLRARHLLPLLTLVAVCALIVLAVMAGAGWMVALPYQHRERVWDALAQQRPAQLPGFLRARHHTDQLCELTMKGDHAMTCSFARRIVDAAAAGDCTPVPEGLRSLEATQRHRLQLSQASADAAARSASGREAELLRELRPLLESLCPPAKGSP